MLSYAFRTLQESKYRDMETEPFENIEELCTAILVKGMSSQIKRGVRCAYISETEALASPKGRIDIAETLRTFSLQKRKLVCSYDEYSVNSYLNRIIKSALEMLLRSGISSPRKKDVKNILRYLGEVKPLDPRTINWRIQYDRNNETYRMLIGICYLVIKGLLQTEKEGSVRLMDFIDDQNMCRLYEKFILEYYRKEFPQIDASASRIPWGLDDEYDEMLPVMQTDVTLQYSGKILIIDAKYYGSATQNHFGQNTLHSGNLYQIFTYVKNKECALKDKPHKVSGMLLYAGTDEAVQPNHIYRMSGNTVAVRTLDLNREFSEIAGQLNAIAEEFLGVEGKRIF
jgi:5-methylcytosine-specific restriction enzyme subunit McrC